MQSQLQLLICIQGLQDLIGFLKLVTRIGQLGLETVSIMTSDVLVVFGFG